MYLLFTNLIVYPDHAVLIRPHGNSKRNKVYRRTRESTKNLLKTELEKSTPKEAVDNVFESKGGVLEVQSAGELPRGRTQAYNIKRALQQRRSSKALVKHSWRKHSNLLDFVICFS